MKFRIFLQNHWNDETMLNHLYNEYHNLLIKYFDDIELYNIFDDHSNYLNIDNLHKYFNEYCCLYYLYKNEIYKKYDIICLGHYRRILDINNVNINEFYYDNVLLEYLYIYEKLIPKENHIKKYNSYIFDLMYVLGIPVKIIKLFFLYLNIYYNEVNIVDDENQYNISWHTCFACNANEFENLMKFIDGFYTFLFNICDIEYEEESILNFINDNKFYMYSNDTPRAFGYLTEYLTSFYFHNISTKNKVYTGMIQIY